MSDPQQHLQDLDDRIESRVQTIRAERDWWPCQRGCDHCCRHLAHPPEISQAEWDRVDAAVAALPEAERAVVEQRIQELLAQIAADAVGNAVVCPYLNEAEGACRIYASRPIPCRTYGFFVARDHDQYCHQIEQEIRDRPDEVIIWGNAETLRQEVTQISSAPIPFEQHYGISPSLS